MTSTVSIPAALASAVRVIAPAWRHCWAVLILAACLTVACFIAPSRPQTMWWPILACFAVLLAKGALWRLASGRLVRRGGLQLGGVEARLTLVWGLSALFLFVLGLLFFVVILGFAYAAASAGHGFVASQVATWASAVDSRGRLLVSAVALFLTALLVWAATRISLAEAATVFEGRLMVLESWPLTRGRVLPIVLTNLALAIVPAALLDIRHRLLLAGLSVLAQWAGLVAGLVLGGLWLPMSVGLMAYFHERRASPA